MSFLFNQTLPLVESTVVLPYNIKLYHVFRDFQNSNIMIFFEVSTLTLYEAAH